MIIEIYGDDQKLGKMIINWEEDAALMTIRGLLEEWVFQRLSKAAPPIGGEPEIQKALDALSVKALALLEKYAGELFDLAQNQIVMDVFAEIRDSAAKLITIHEIDDAGKILQPPLATLDELEGRKFKEFRKRMAESFKRIHNERIGVRPGRQAQVSIEKIMEHLSKLPKGISLTMLAAEMDLSPRTIQYTLKAAGLTFAAAKRKAKK